MSLLILGASSLQAPLIAKAQSLGYHVCALDVDNDAPGALLADEFFAISTNDTDAVYNLAKEKKISGILTTSDFPVRVVAYVAEKLGLPGPAPRIAEICTNKSLQRELLQKENFPCPQFKSIKDKSDLEEIEGWNYPLVVKPVDSSASRGVQKINERSELHAAYKYALNNSKSGDVVIEEFIEGPEYSVEVLIQENISHIIAVTEKVTAGYDDRFFVEEIHVVPATLSVKEKSEIHKVVNRYIKVLGLNNSAAHVEVKLNPKGVYIIEAAARLGGDYITSDLVPLATGVDMLKEIISLSVGKRIDIEKTKNELAGIHFFTPDNYESALRHLEKKFHRENFVKVVMEEKKEKLALKSSLDRLGYIIVKAKNRKELDQILLF